MRVIRDIYNLTPLPGCVVTIGNFDGLHLGHQALLERLKLKGQELNLPTVVIVFEPQPNEFFSSQQPVTRLMRFREKVEGLRALGIDQVLCLRFDEKMARVEADEFVKSLLVDTLRAKFILVGDDFRFGYQRRGDYSLLEQLGRQYGFEVECLPTFEKRGKRVSSTWVRELLEAGHLERVEELLGHPYSMQGKVVHGYKRGQELGFPTANIHLHCKRVPIAGIFAVEMLGVGSKPVPGVANVGNRPTFEGDTRTLLEVHLLDFQGDIYLKKVEVKFLKKFRDEEKYNTIEQLTQQIAKDVLAAKKFHGLDG